MLYYIITCKVDVQDYLRKEKKENDLSLQEIHSPWQWINYRWKDCSKRKKSVFIKGRHYIVNRQALRLAGFRQKKKITTLFVPLFRLLNWGPTRVIIPSPETAIIKQLSTRIDARQATTLPWKPSLSLSLSLSVPPPRIIEISREDKSKPKIIETETKRERENKKLQIFA